MTDFRPILFVNREDETTEYAYIKELDQLSYFVGEEPHKESVIEENEEVKRRILRVNGIL